MDKDLRNLLFGTTQAIRRLLEEEFSLQLEGTFDVHADGRIAEQPGSQLSATERLVRGRIVEAIQHRLAVGESAAEAVRGFQSEAVFTFLNRLAALKMMEARALVLPCVSQGDQSQGFKEFSGLAPGLIELPDKGYRLYLECLFDEIGREVGVLFDRTDAASQLWPRRKALEAVLAKLNTPELAGVWGEDETIGWIYQYYNDPEERALMRDTKRGGSAAPRNSREMAVRNQFFTPRYVVEFLTDNALGRLWYEMTRGETQLKERCRYLIRRPNEVFLPPGKNPEPLPQEADLSQQPVQIPHRPIKDPRTILMIDPACGSMHFGLYAFDLFEVIYQEAWELEEKAGTGALARSEGMKPIHEGYPTKEAFLRDVPRLILEHNIHGIDIDPRAAQIAGLALWLRAQKSWQRLGLKPADRPAIRRSNIVCAEPMPGEKELLREFVDRQFPAGERPLFQAFLESVWDRMRLAGEAGSLLQIEDEIRTLVAEAKQRWKDRPRFEQTTMFPGLEAKPQQEEMRLDVSGITDEQFWEKVEERVYSALRTFAERSESAGGFQRRLFAEDAARGFAFIDLCRQRYDVALMNPPFGQFPVQIEQPMRRLWQSHANDIYVPFILWASSRLEKRGRLGAITSRNFLIGRDQREFRPLILGKGEASLEAFVDLGLRVLDGAEVDTATYVLSKESASADTGCNYWDFRNESRESLHSLESLLLRNSPIFRRLTDFWDTPANLIAFAASSDELADLSSERSLDPHFGRVTKGLSSSDDFRFLKLMWEPRPVDLGKRWIFCAKGADYLWVIANINTVVDWHQDGELLAAYASVVGDNIAQARRSSAYYLKPGLTHTYRCDDFSLRALPAGCIFTNGSPIISPLDQALSPDLLALFLSRRFEKLLSFVSKKGLYETGRVGLLPAPPRRYGTESSQDWRSLVSFLMSHERRLEYTTYFVVPGDVNGPAFDQLRCRQLLSNFASLAQEEISTGFIDRGTKGYADRYATHAHAMDDWVSYAVGSAFGRWDIRYATGQQSAPVLPDPFAPLPICPPGQLQTAQGLPAGPEDVPTAYPIRIPWDGILVDDEHHPRDVIDRVREALRVIWKDRTESIEQGACETLGVKSLRDWFRRPTGFFADHLSRYSKSRRQAPIYWPLSSPNGLYTVWLYYHRLTADTLFTVLRDHLKPKLEFEERRAFQLRQEAGSTPLPSQRRDIAEAEELVEDLRAFKAELERVAPLFRPNLNDGVIINYAPLWRMIGLPKWRKDCQAIWNELAMGDYDWAHLAMHLWPERVVPKCATDRSLAIAHGLESVFWQEDPEKPGKWIARKVTDLELRGLISERTSAAVKAAVESLVGATSNEGAPRRGRKGAKA